MKILMAVSECVPFVKVVRLADVAGSLPLFVSKKKHSVVVVLPKYQQIDDKKFNLKTLPHKLSIPIGLRHEEAIIKEGRLNDDIPVYFIENDKYFGRPGVYGTRDGDYEDNRERFIFFSRAVLETAKAVGFQPDIIHSHDWQSALIPAYLKTVYSLDSYFSMTSTVLTIHNIAYQGYFGRDTIDMGGFLPADFTPDKFEFFGGFNFLKSGLIFADTLSTVSPTYSKEIQYWPNGRGMEGVIASRKNELYGILNGIDYSYWNPKTDPFIVENYSGEDYHNKAVCKKDLQRECGFEENQNTLLIGAVSRKDYQKGYDIIGDAIQATLGKEVQFVLHGSGDARLENYMVELSNSYPDRVKVILDFNEPLAHKIYAGSDVFLMPSRYEPCGLSQMIALKYGSIPLATRTGGLADTITDFTMNPEKGNGFLIDGTSPYDLVLNIEKAIELYSDDAQWEKLLKNAFNSDFPWKSSVDEYIKMYKHTLSRGGKTVVYE